MAENWIIEQTVELTRPVQPYVGQPVELMLPGDHLAHTLRIKCKEKDMPVNLTGYTAAGYFKRTDGNTVLVVGSITGNTVDVTLTQECYAFAGNLRGVVRITNTTTNAKITLCDRLFHVGQSVDDGGIIDPGEVIPSLDDLLAEIDEMEQATAAAEAAASAVPDMIAPTFSTSKAYASGDYVYYDGDLYCFTAAHAAGAWAGTDAVEVQLSPEVADLKSAVAQANRSADNIIKFVGAPTFAQYGGFSNTGVQTNGHNRAKIIEYDVTGANSYRLSYPSTIIFWSMRQYANGAYTSSSTGYSNKFYTVQDGVTKICVSFAKSGDQTLEISEAELKQISIIPEYAGLNKQVHDLEGTVANHETRLTSVESAIDTANANIGKKIDKTYNPNLNLDPYYTNVGTGIPQLNPASNWGFSNTSEVYSVSGGKLTYTQADTNDKLYKAVSLINGHDYYFYLPVTGSGSMVLHFAGKYTAEKYDNNYIENNFTCGLSTGTVYAQIRAKSTTSYTLGMFVLLDLTDLGITLAEAKQLKDALIGLGTNNLEKTLIKTMISDYKPGIESSVVNVMDYGAKGDGTTDDTSAIAAAVTACPSGGTVFIPGGTYKISNIACKSNMAVKGEGRATILAFADNVVPPSGQSRNCLTVINVSNVFISDLTMDGNRTNNAASSSSVDADDSFNCVSVVHSDNIYIDNIWGHSAGYHGVIMVDAHHVEVKNSKFWDNGFRPIHGHSTVNDVKVINNEVWANGQGFEGVGHAAYDAIYFFDDVHHLEIRDNYIHDSTSIGGIQIGGNYVGDGDPSSDIMIIDNFIDNRNLEDDTKSKYGIHIMGDCITNLSIINNSITGDRGIFMNNYHDRGANTNVSIIGNTIYNCKTYGIYVTEAYYDCIVSNNQIVGGTQAGIQIEKNEKLTITGNVVVDYERGIHIKNGTDVVIASNVVEKRGASAPTMQASIKADDTNTNVWLIYNIVGRAPINSGTGAVTLPAS